ncbi:hypothetical protein G7Y79_00009g026210 [Physcia stellaris]|nr:hypothetical protein G7Y79_00009g026210 [Physcia stellaris]
MASGFGLAGGPSRCFPFWQELLACYVVNTETDDIQGAKKCIPALEDYYECLHHKKEGAQTRFRDSSTELKPTKLNYAYKRHVEYEAYAHCVKLQARPARLDLDSQLLSFAIVPTFPSSTTYFVTALLTIKMAWRNQGITGSNNIPLGTRRRFGGNDSTPPVDDGGYNPSQPLTGMSDGKRGRSPERADPVDGGERRRKKRNRWGDASENKAAGLMGLPTEIKANMTNEQLEAYVLHLRIQEISEKLRINDVVPADGDRSPSPPPQYDNFGRRVNTREYRYRKRLEDERHKQIEKAMKIIPNYHPPSDYRRPTKTQEKVYVPVNDYPEINFSMLTNPLSSNHFLALPPPLVMQAASIGGRRLLTLSSLPRTKVGLLIGPRGNTLKKMETESLAKIAIRGKGSVKEGKGRSDAAHTSNQEEDLHCLIMADTEEKVNKAKKLIHNVIETAGLPYTPWCGWCAKRFQAASIPEGQNELKRNQLRELAALNGTLRDDENQACQNCGQIGHRKYDCPEQRNFTANIICRVCGNAGHMARDCPDRQRGANWRNDAPGGAPDRPAIGGGDAVDREYEQLMNELSGGAPAANGATQRIEAGPGGYGGGADGYGEGDRDLKPWQKGPTGAAAPWARGGNDRRDDYQSRDGGSAPPWAAGGHGGDNYGGYGQQSGGYGAPPGGAAPWQRQQEAPPPPPSGGQDYGYGGYPGGYGGSGGYGGQSGIGAPPGLGGSAGGLGAPPGLPSMYQGYGAKGSNGAPPPPPGEAPPPPPPSDQPPPPPPPGA